MESRRSLAPLLAAAALALLWAGPAGSEGHYYLPAEEQEAWAEELATASRRVEASEQRLEQAETAYSRARHENYPRGEALAEIEREFADAKRDLAAAREALEALVEEADDSGVLPEVLRPYR